MLSAHHVAWTHMEADRAFSQAARSRRREFDSEFRPSPRTRKRWVRVWIAEHTGPELPTISVVRVGDIFAIRDGHHRVSVAQARGAVTIDAIVA
jgi:hypothetical protein